MSCDFDAYVKNYRDIINDGAKITGENYEYFIQLRIKLLINKVRKKIANKRNLKILDFGCGTGITELYLKSSFPDSTIYGTDISEESIKAANALHIDNVLFVNAESLTGRFGDNYFDLIYSNGTIHHLPRETHAAVFEKLHRLLKIDGDMFIFENNPFNPLMRKAMKKNPFDKEAHFIYPKYLRNILNDAGFKTHAINYYVFYPKYLKFLRSTERYLVRVPCGAQYFAWSSKGLSA